MNKNMHFLFAATALMPFIITAQTNNVEFQQRSDQRLLQGKLKCQSAISTGGFQTCWFSVLRDNKPLKNLEIHLSGGMPQHQHGLPTSPKVKWSEEKHAHVIKGLKFSMPGNWMLNFKIQSDDDKIKDQITYSIKVDG